MRRRAVVVSGNSRMSSQQEKRPFEIRRQHNAPSNRIFNAPAVIVYTALFIIGCFVLTILAPQPMIRLIEYTGAVSPERFLAGPEANGGLLSMLSPLISHMFFHGSILHIGFNMIWFLAFGTPIARRMGAIAGQGFAGIYASSIFLTFFLLSGVAGALAFIFVHPNDSTLMIGASGGVSGLLGGLVRFAFNGTSLLGPEHARISRLASRPVLLWTSIIVILNVSTGLIGGPLAGGASIAWEAHLGGYFFGLLTYPFFERAARGFYRR